ncbi:zinc dependent phospholipase C family protein [Paenibacillus donghaensis]|uniref:Phospholipase C/D domain-containing protein n=1 Tax=Paenibacillus donghaensis TaxID=414771 RepID=A0A2Z2KEK4_9BACL|nr:zinc dependent phospholipase C family protein [Paenibacillus donghaensis]ASA20479.1 hypothetical protein B9T62_06480 [Paenibacillus donghaensis]
MPNIWMHLEYGKQLAAEFADRLPFLSGLKQYGNLYRFGCQGPDSLYYHSFLPWRKERSAARLGDLMHSHSCGPVLVEFWQRASALPPAESVQTQLYFLGYLTHHLLDRNLHPYINWKAGYKQRDHGRFELALDTVFMNKVRGLDTWRLAAWKQIDIGSSGLPEPIQTILQDTAATWYPEAMKYLPAEIWEESYLDMVLAHKCLYDPHGWKKALLRKKARSYFYQKLTEDEQQLDYLNGHHTEWRHSALYSEARTDSVAELWEQAMAEGRTVLQALADWLFSPSAAEANSRLEAFKLVLGDRSYDTGKECSSNLQNQYSEPIWEQHVSS